MRHAVRVLAALVCGAGFLTASPAPAASTPFGDDHFGLYVSNLQNLGTMYGYTSETPEGVSITKAVAHFSDPSSTFAEDITDYRKGLGRLRESFGREIGQLQTNKELMAKFLNDRSVGIVLTMIGLANAAYARDSIQTRFKIYTKVSALSNMTNEQKMLKKAATIMASIQAHARKKRVNLYVSQ